MSKDAPRIFVCSFSEHNSCQKGLDTQSPVWYIVYPVRE